MRILNPGPAVASSDDFAGAAARAARGNRRRLQVFASVFILCLVVGMAWNLLRPAEYRAIARVQLTLPALNAAPPPASAPLPASDIGADFVAQVQRLNSRPLLELVQQRLLAAGHRIEAPGGDAVSQLQSMIGVHPVPNSAVIELSATGAPPSLLAMALNELVALYREQLLASYSTDDDQRLAQTRDELVRLEQTASERQMQLERFRGGAGLLSTERDENESVARARGLTTALNAAMEKQATAEARLRALQDAVTVGQGAAAARDDPTLASLEHRASQLREELARAEPVVHGRVHGHGCPRARSAHATVRAGSADRGAAGREPGTGPGQGEGGRGHRTGQRRAVAGPDRRRTTGAGQLLGPLCAGQGDGGRPGDRSSALGARRSSALRDWRPVNRAAARPSTCCSQARPPTGRGAPTTGVTAVSCWRARSRSACWRWAWSNCSTARRRTQPRRR